MITIRSASYLRKILNSRLSYMLFYMQNEIVHDYELRCNPECETSTMTYFSVRVFDITPSDAFKHHQSDDGGGTSDQTTLFCLETEEKQSRRAATVIVMFFMCTIAAYQTSSLVI